MKKMFSDIYSGLIKSLDNKSEGFSGKKLTALSLVACIIAAHVKWILLGNFSQLVTVLVTDYGFVAVLFGINTYDKKANKVEDIKEVPA